MYPAHSLTYFIALFLARGVKVKVPNFLFRHWAFNEMLSFRCFTVQGYNWSSARKISNKNNDLIWYIYDSVHILCWLYRKDEWVAHPKFTPGVSDYPVLFSVISDSPACHRYDVVHEWDDVKLRKDASPICLKAFSCHDSTAAMQRGEGIGLCWKCWLTPYIT